MKRVLVSLICLVSCVMLIGCSKLCTKQHTPSHRMIAQYVDIQEISLPDLVAEIDSLLSIPNEFADSLIRANRDSCDCDGGLYHNNWQRYVITQVTLDEKRERILLDVQGLLGNRQFYIDVMTDSVFCGGDYAAYKSRYAPNAEIMVLGSCLYVYGSQIVILNKEALHHTIAQEIYYY